MNQINQYEENEQLDTYECEHEYEHVDHLENVADGYRRELFVCMYCNKEKVVTKYFGVRD